MVPPREVVNKVSNLAFPVIGIEKSSLCKCLAWIEWRDKRERYSGKKETPTKSQQVTIILNLLNSWRAVHLFFLHIVTSSKNTNRSRKKGLEMKKFFTPKKVGRKERLFDDAVPVPTLSTVTYLCYLKI